MITDGGDVDGCVVVHVLDVAVLAVTAREGGCLLQQEVTRSLLIAAQERGE